MGRLDGETIQSDGIERGYIVSLLLIVQKKPTHAAIVDSFILLSAFGGKTRVTTVGLH